MSECFLKEPHRLILEYFVVEWYPRLDRHRSGPEPLAVALVVQHVVRQGLAKASQLVHDSLILVSVTLKLLCVTPLPLSALMINREDLGAEAGRTYLLI